MLKYLFCAGLLVASGLLTNLASAERPNVIVIMSDDQGVGDYGFMGNDIIKTPSLDSMFKRSAYLSNFYVSPVCAPTRASLMTGRYNYRTRCIDTYVGRAMMDADETTLAEFLRDAGYNTGIYGKWHLGDNYPLRAMDQGFQDSLVHRGGGIGQPSDPIGAEGKYTDPILIKNGEEVQMKGYCTDIYFDAAMDFISKSKKSNKNFFTYIATNAPHGPFHDVPEDLYNEYKKVDFSPIIIRKLNEKQLTNENDKLARISAMITNIDENVGRLFKKLDELDLTDNTIVIYLNDNGPNSLRYVGNMRGMKTGVDDGGIRSPLVMHWPAKVDASNQSDLMCAHIDLLPTILDACEVEVTQEHKLDGRSFLPLLTSNNVKWKKRQIAFQSHRGNQPKAFHHFAFHEYPWKLVHPSGFGNESFSGKPKLELYNLKDDPQQLKDLSKERPEVLNRLKAAYAAWFKDVSTSRPNNYDPPRIVIGTPHEEVSVLTRQDWRHVEGRPWGRDSNGFWLLEAPKPGEYELEIILSEPQSAGTAVIKVGDLSKEIKLNAGDKRGHITNIKLDSGMFALSVALDFDGEKLGPHQVILTHK